MQLITNSGGAGNDTIVATSNLANTDTIDGGDGTDTLTITTVDITNPSVMGGVSNIEVIKPLVITILLLTVIWVVQEHSCLLDNNNQSITLGGAAKVGLMQQYC